MKTDTDGVSTTSPLNQWLSRNWLKIILIVAGVACWFGFVQTKWDGFLTRRLVALGLIVVIKGLFIVVDKVTKRAGGPG